MTANLPLDSKDKVSVGQGSSKLSEPSFDLGIPSEQLELTSSFVDVKTGLKKASKERSGGSKRSR